MEHYFHPQTINPHIALCGERPWCVPARTGGRQGTEDTCMAQGDLGMLSLGFLAQFSWAHTAAKRRGPVVLYSR